MALNLLYTGCPGLKLGNQLSERTQMNTMLLKMYVKFQDLMSREEGQDLVEYALVLALIALGAVASMRTVANSISIEFSTIQSTFSSAVA